MSSSTTSTSLGTTSVHFITTTEWTTTTSLIARRQMSRCASPRGHHSGCPLLAAGESSHTVSSCTARTHELKGDTFDLKNGKCFVKLCKSPDMQYSTQYGEHEVYSAFCEDVPLQSTTDGIAASTVTSTSTQPTARPVEVSGCESLSAVAFAAILT